MATTTALPGEYFAQAHAHDHDHDLNLGVAPQSRSAVSWAAIAAGGAAAAALSLILLILGVGLGLSSVSPWSGEGMRAGTFGIATIAWLTLTQLLASALGGYLAGRLRVRWHGVHRDEVYFRDTAHGFLSWAVASLATAALLTSTIGTILGGGVQAGATVVGGTGAAAVGAATSAAGGANADGSSADYFIDTLFRRDAAAPSAVGVGGAGGAAASLNEDARTNPSELAEVSRIFLHASRTEPLPADDQSYVARLVAQRTGLSQTQAETRVSATYARMQAGWAEAETAARDTANKARKASAYGALWLFISLLVGAFVASWAATLGGQQRDN